MLFKESRDGIGKGNEARKLEGHPRVDNSVVIRRRGGTSGNHDPGSNAFVLRLAVFTELVRALKRTTVSPAIVNESPESAATKTELQ